MAKKFNKNATKQYFTVRHTETNHNNEQTTSELQRHKITQDSDTIKCSDKKRTEPDIKNMTVREDSEQK